MNDRKIGYIVISLLVLIIGGTLGFSIYTLLYPAQRRVILFKEVGNLAISDQVYFNGLRIGVVKEMAGIGEKVAVTIILDKPFDIYSNYSIYTADKGLMGDRLISIDPGDSLSGKVSVQDTLYGEFFIGVSEILGLAWKLEKAMDTMVPLAKRLLAGAEDTLSFVDQFYTIAYAIDSLSIRLARASTTANRELDKQIRTINSALASTVRISRILSKDGPELIQDLESMINDINDFIATLKTMIAGVEDILQRMQSAEGLLGDTMAKKINDSLIQLHTVITDLERGATRIRLIIRRLKE